MEGPQSELDHEHASKTSDQANLALVTRWYHYIHDGNHWPLREHPAFDDGEDDSDVSGDTTASLHLDEEEIEAMQRSTGESGN